MRIGSGSGWVCVCVCVCWNAWAVLSSDQLDTLSYPGIAYVPTTAPLAPTTRPELVIVRTMLAASPPTIVVCASTEQETMIRTRTHDDQEN